MALHLCTSGCRAYQIASGASRSNASRTRTGHLSPVLSLSWYNLSTKAGRWLPMNLKALRKPDSLFPSIAFSHMLASCYLNIIAAWHFFIQSLLPGTRSSAIGRYSSDCHTHTKRRCLDHSFVEENNLLGENKKRIQIGVLLLHQIADINPNPH